jgi:hypothetical protein
MSIAVSAEAVCTTSGWRTALLLGLLKNIESESGAQRAAPLSPNRNLMKESVMHQDIPTFAFVGALTRLGECFA